VGDDERGFFFFFFFFGYGHSGPELPMRWPMKALQMGCFEEFWSMEKVKNGHLLLDL